jgi:hypothetical protein
MNKMHKILQWISCRRDQRITLKHEFYSYHENSIHIAVQVVNILFENYPLLVPVDSLIPLTRPTQPNAHKRGKQGRSMNRRLIFLSTGMETVLLGTSGGPGCKAAVLISSLTDCGHVYKYITRRRGSYSCCPFLTSVKWVPVTTAWRVLRLRMEKRSPLWRVAANMLNKQSGQPTRSSPPAWEFGEVLSTPHRKNFTKASGLDFSFGLRGVLWSVLLPKFNRSDQIKKEIGGTSSTLREKRYVPDFGGEFWG